MFPRRKCTAPVHKKDTEPHTNLSNDRMIVERLPARILLSADLPGLDLLALDTTSPSDSELQQRLRAALLNHQSTADVADPVLADPSGLDDDVVASRVLIVVDPQVTNYQQLIADVSSTAPQDTELTILVLEPGQDGLSQISKQLSTLDDIDAVHLFSHSSSSGITLGNDQLSLANLTDNTAQLELWKSSLSDDADILIYGCDLAGSSDGQALIEQISQLTGADVAASDNTTGTAVAGGDWELEYRTGEINSDVPISLAMQDDYASVLGTFTVLNTNDSGAGSLREAITDANNAVGADTIEFNIAGGGPHVIALSSALPSITEEVFIDGTSEPDFIGNGSNPIVVIDGNDLNGDGINVTATGDNSEIRGLVIRDFVDNAISIDAGADNVVVAGNFLGSLDTNGLEATGESIGAAIVYVEGGNAVIGGNTNADRNVIAGGANGVVVTGSVATGAQVSGNFIGVDETGNNVVAITFDGVRVEFNAANAIIGGATAEHGNLIAGVGEDGIHIRDGGSDLAAVSNNVIGVSESGDINLGVGRAGVFLQNSVDFVTINDNLIAGTAASGIEIDGTSNDTTIQGNIIGTDATLSYNWGAGENGILIQNGAVDTIVGGFAAGQGNVVAHSGAFSAVNNAGVAIQGTSTGNDVYGNSIYGNGGPGIDLSVASNDGVDLNDVGDTDTGGNNKQNVAVFSTASVNSTGGFSYNIDTSTLNAGTYSIDFYASDDLDGGEVEGKRYLTSTSVPGSGSAGGTLPGVVLAPGEYVTLTATDALGNTSEFSNYVVATASPDDLLVTTSSAGGLSINQDGGNDVYLQADDGSAILGGLTSVTVEAQLTLDSAPEFPHVINYQVPGEERELSLLLNNDAVRFSIGGTSVSFAGTYAQLRDGEAHTISVSWDGATGDLMLYIDGAHQDTISGFQSGYTLVGGGTLVVGNHQDSPGAGFQANQSLHGALSDIRLFDQARSANDILANYDTALAHDEPGMLANWQFDSLSANGVLLDSVSANNLTLLHTAEPGFTASSASLELSVDENALTGTVVGSVAGYDSEREALIANLLASNTELYYNAETQKFYQYVDTGMDWTAARDNALATTLNGVSGQLITIDSATENQQFVDILNANGATQAYLQASDAATEGEWRQGDLATDTLFWQGNGSGVSANDRYSNWDLSNPNNFGSAQHYAKIFAANGAWDDVDGTGIHKSVIEFDADTVLDNAGPIDQQPLIYSIIGQSIGGAFSIDADVGTLSIADATSLDYESLAAHVVTVRVTDVDGNSYDEAITVTLRNLSESSNSLTNLTSGIELNTGDGNDAYLIANDGGSLLGGRDKFTFETAFTLDKPGYNVLASYATTTNSNDFLLEYLGNGTLVASVNGTGTGALSGIDYSLLADGQQHSLAFSWDNTNGDYRIYVDGELVDSGTGLVAGETVRGGVGSGELMFGQEQDSPIGGFSTAQVFSGTLYDIRIWDEVRTEAEIAQNYQKKFDTGSLPSSLLANWQMDGFNGSSEVVEIIGGNNLSIGHAIGAGFISSTPVPDLNVNETSADGVSVGFVVPSSSYAVNNLVHDGSFLEAADPPVILDTYFEDGSGSGNVVGAWTVTKESVDLISIDHAQSPLGGRVIELDGDLPGGISQILSTEVGKQYQVVFAMSGDFDNGDEFKQVRVSAAGMSEDHSMAQPPNWIWGHPDYFESRSFTFVADSASTTLTIESLSSAGSAWGPLIGDVQVLEIPQSVQTILNNDPNLTYDAVTDKFYKVVTTTADVATAMSNADADQINGVGGQLVTIRSPYEQELVRELAGYSGSFFYMGATDASVEGEWNWIEDGVEADRFWNGGVGGSAPVGAYANFAGEPGGASAENYALIRPSDGLWLDISGLGDNGYIIEWSASETLSNFTYSLTDDAGGRFAIDSNSGEVTVADSSLIDYATATTHNVDVQVTDAAGNSYSETMSIAVNKGIEPTQLLPGAQSTNEDTPLVFGAGNGNAVLVSDSVDNENTRLQVFISTNNNGTLTLSQTTGLAILGGSNGGTYMTIQGAESDINAAFEGMTFNPASDFVGSVTLNMTTSLGSDMVGHYTFESGTVSGSTVVDQSAGISQNGTLNGNAAIVNDIERGDVLSLDGAGDFVEISGLMDTPADMTLSAWINADGVDAAGGVVISTGTSPALYLHSDGSLIGYYESGVTTNILQTTESLVGTGWRHVAVSIDATNSNMTLYVDGVAVETASTVGPIEYDNFPDTYIGREGAGGTGFDFDGMIDEARIYSRALTAEEIAAIATDNTASSDSVAITVVAVNDAPTFGATLDGTPTFVEGGAAVVLDSDVQIFDEELSDIDDFSGATLTLARNGGADAQDQYSATGTLVSLNQGFNNLVVGTTTIGSVTQNSNGTLVLTFNGNASNALVNEAMQQIAYSNSSNSPPVTTQIDWTFDDGGDSVNIQGNPGALSVTGSTTVDLTAANDDPVITFGSGNVSYIENASAIFIDASATVTDADLTDFNGGVLWINMTANGSADDRIRINNEGMNAGQVGMSTGPNEVYYGGVLIGTWSGSGAPLAIVFNAAADASAVEAVAQNITFENLSDDPSTLNRTVQFVLADGDGGTSAVISKDIVVIASNDPSVITSDGGAATASVNAAENQTAVTTVAASDVDSGDVPTYTISGGSDAALFGVDLNSGVLTFSTAPDFETFNDSDTDGVYEVEVTASDGNGGTDIQLISVSVTDVNEGPTLVSLSNSAVVENTDTSSGLSVGILTSTDVDVGDSFTYSIVGGVDAGAFSIGGASSDELILTDGVLDFESQSSYSVIIRTMDAGGLTFDQALVITVTDVNEAPTFTTMPILSGLASTEDVAYSINISTTDPDTGNSLTITAPTLPAWLTLTDNGDGTAILAGTPTNADVGSHAVSLQVSDGSLQNTQNFTVTVANTNDAPVITSDGGAAIASINVAENQTTVTTVEASDVDSGDVPTYTISGGSDAALFGVDLNSGVLTFSTAPDFETFTDANTDGIYDVEVTAADGNGGTDVQLISVTVTNVNEVPTLVSLSNSAVVENTDTSSGLSVGILTSTDVDAGDSFTYSVVGGVDAGAFSIGGASSDELILTDGVLDFESQPSYSLIIRTTDAGGLTFDQALVVTVTDVNEAPTFSSTAILSSTEDVAYSYNIATTDPDTGASLTITAPTLPTWLTLVDNGDGTATLSGTPTNTEVGPHNVGLQVSDGSLQDTQDFTITVSNVNDAPMISSDGGAATASVNAAENQTAVTTVTASDVDSGDVPTFTVSGGSDAALFSVDLNSGVLTFNTAPDYETFTDSDTNGVYDVEITAADGNGGTDVQLISVTVTNVNEAPTLVSLSNSVVADNIDSSSGLSVGTLTSSDVDAGDSFTYSVVGGVDAAAFSIGGVGSDELILTDGVLDFESQASYAVTIRTTDSSGLTYDQALVITVTDVNEAPAFNSTAVLLSTEDVAYSYNIATTDPDTGASLTITAPTLPTWLTLLDNGDGTATLSGTPTNTEVGPHNVSLQVSDGSLQDTQDFTITVSNVNDAPMISSDGGAATASVNAAENQTAVTTVTASDVDSGDVPTFTVSGGSDAALFSVDLNSGVLTFNTAPDYETFTDSNTDGVYDVEITAADGNGGADVQLISVTVTNVNEVPTLVSLSSNAVVENTDTSGGFSVGTLTSTDIDAGESLSYSIVGGVDAALFTIGGASSDELILTDGVLDFESQPSYAVIIRTTDLGGLTNDQVMVITVTDVNETPTFSSTAPLTSTEDVAYNYNIATIDPDTGNSLTITASTSPTWLTLIDNGNGTATLSGTPTNADVGTHSVSLQVSDGSLLDTQDFVISVSNENNAPVITTDGGAAMASVNVAENQTIVTTVAATDVDSGDVPTYTISGGADAALFGVDVNTGVLTFNTSPNFETFADANTDGVYDVEITAADGNGGHDVQLISVTLSDVNEAPVITSDGGSTTASLAVAENQLAVTTVTVSDVDLNDAPVFSIIGGDDAGHFQIDSASGELSFTVMKDFLNPTDSDKNGQYEVEVSVSDRDGLVVTQRIAVVITSVPELNAALPVEHTSLEPYVAPQVVPTNSSSEMVEQNEPEEIEEESDSVPELNAEPESIELSFPVSSLPLEFQIESATSVEEVVEASPAKSETAKDPENRLSKYLRIWISAMSDSANSFQDELDRQRFLDELANQMDGYDEQAEAEANKKKLVAQVTAGLSITLTAGFVSWILRAGSMVASLLTSMPAWRQLDLLPILSKHEDKDIADTPNDDNSNDEDTQGDDPDDGVDSLLRKTG